MQKIQFGKENPEHKKIWKCILKKNFWNSEMCFRNSIMKMYFGNIFYHILISFKVFFVILH